MGRAIIFVLLAVLIFATLIHLSLFVGMKPELLAVFARALGLSTMLAAVPVTLLWFLDRRERESPLLFAAAFLWGGCIATALALPLNNAVFKLVDDWLAQYPTLAVLLGPDAPLMIVAPLSAPIVEEIAKALGVILLFWLLRPEFDNMRDGLVYGALIGVGFTWFETALYVTKLYAKFGEPAFGLQLGMRYALFGLGGHAMFTAIFGASLGLALQTRRTWLKIAAPIVGLLLSILAHMINNALPLYAALTRVSAGKPLPDPSKLPDIGFLQAFMVGSAMQLTLFRALPGAHGACRLAERRLGAPGDPRGARGRSRGQCHRGRISRDRRRFACCARVASTACDKDASAALVNAQHELAFRKRRVRDEGGDPEQDSLVAGWREDIRRLRTA